MISVIIPAYNAEKFIANAINSVLDQGHSTEIIVINDRSTDKTKTIVEGLAKMHSNIVCLDSTRRQGPSGARNMGLLRATGDYITFLDADDLWCGDHLDQGMTFFEDNTGIDVVFFNGYIKDYDTGKILFNWFEKCSFRNNLTLKGLRNCCYLIDDDLFRALLDESFLHLSSMIIKREAVEGVLFNENIKHSEDRDFAIKLYEKGADFAFKDVITRIYHRHSGNLSSTDVTSALNTVKDHITLFTDYKESTTDKVAIKKLNRLLLDRHLEAAYCQRQLNEYQKAFKHYLISLKYGLSVGHLKELPKILASIPLFYFRRVVL